MCSGPLIFWDRCNSFYCVGFSGQCPMAAAVLSPSTTLAEPRQLWGQSGRSSSSTSFKHWIQHSNRIRGLPTFVDASPATTTIWMNDLSSEHFCSLYIMIYIFGMILKCLLLFMFSTDMHEDSVDYYIIVVSTIGCILVLARLEYCI